MANRPMSSGRDSSSASTVELPPLSGLNRNGVLPEEWTLPHEWKIEKREMNDIANIATNLNQSLEHFPHPEVGQRFDYSDKVNKAEVEKQKTMQSATTGGNNLLYGLARLPNTQQF
ncbi:hypothetical protein ACOMHN_065770 [Nucella lapillus]